MEYYWHCLIRAQAATAARSLLYFKDFFFHIFEGQGMLKKLPNFTHQMSWKLRSDTGPALGCGKLAQQRTLQSKTNHLVSPTWLKFSMFMYHLQAYERIDQINFKFWADLWDEKLCYLWVFTTWRRSGIAAILQTTGSQPYVTKIIRFI